MFSKSAFSNPRRPTIFASSARATKKGQKEPWKESSPIVDARQPGQLEKAADGGVEWRHVAQINDLAGPLFFMVEEEGGKRAGCLETGVYDKASENLFDAESRDALENSQLWTLSLKFKQQYPESVSQITLGQLLGFQTNTLRRSTESHTESNVAFKDPITGLYLEIDLSDQANETAEGKDDVFLPARFSAAAISPACEFRPTFLKGGQVLLECPMVTQFMQSKGWNRQNATYCLALRDGRVLCCPVAEDKVTFSFVVSHQRKSGGKSSNACNSSDGAQEEPLERIEKSQNKKYQSWGTGRSVVSQLDSSQLKSAQEKGTLQSLLLDSRQKLKSDKYCK